ncbi:MAG: M48 family metalloprotease, partial [Elusimicrobiaceae bacterium]|nr:M48 family metalloprotease [Elusimicrobiaceae bacterium]
MALAYDYVQRNQRRSQVLIILFVLSFVIFTYLATWIFFLLKEALAYFRPTGFLTWGSSCAFALSQTLDVCKWLLPASFLISLFWAYVALNEGEQFVLGRLRGVRLLAKYDEYGANTTLTNLCIRTGDIVPRVYMLRDKGLNAFSVGSRPDNAAIVLSEGLLKKLEFVQLEAVLAHELAHIRNGDTRL